MNQETTRLLTEFSGNSPASSEALTSLECFFEEFRKAVPATLREILSATDGAEGFVGKNYLMLWGAVEIVKNQDAYEVPLNAPGLIIFGSSGGGEAYAFDTRAETLPVVRVPFVGMALDLAIPVASCFDTFLAKLVE